MTEDTDPDTIFNIAMGAVGGQQIKKQHRICIDDIVLEKIEEPEMKPEEAGKNLLKNGDFSNEKDNWNIYIKAPEDATTNIADNAIVYHISNAGTEDWNVQLKQSGLTLEEGCKYRVTFKATSTAARTIKLAIMSTSYKWYGGDDNIQLSENKKKDVVCEFTMSEETDSNADFVISMGKIDGEDTPPSDITLSDFSLVKVR